MSVPAPDSLSASQAGTNKINLSWHNNLAYDSMRVARKKGAGSWDLAWKYISYASSYSDTTPEDGTQYTYKIAGLHTGEWSAFSNDASAITPLKAPDQLDGSATEVDECELTWHGNSANQTGYKLYMDGGLIQTLPGLTYTKTGLTEGSSHSYKVKAYNTDTDSAYSSTINVAQLTRPTAPSLCAAAGISTSAIRITWQDNSDDETGFRIYGSDTGISYSEIASSPVGRNVTTVNETGLVSNKLRYYNVKSYSGAGTSAASNSTSATTFAAISTPTEVTVVPISGTVADVYFQDNSSEEDDHRLERVAGTALPEAILDGGFEVWASATDLTYWTELLQGTSTINREATTIHAGNYGLRLDIDASDHYALIYQDLTMTPSAAYIFSAWYQTAALKTACIRVRDSASNVRLKSDGTWIADDGSGIIMPTTSGAWAQYTFAFSAHASYSAYRVYIGHYVPAGSTSASNSIYIDDFSLSGSGFAEVVTVPANASAARMTGLSAGTTYSIRIRAREGGAYSNYSSTVTFTTLATPAQVTGMAISEIQDTWMKIGWTKIAGVTGYKIKKSISGGAYTLVATVWGDDILSYKAQGLTASTLYGFEVAAYNGAGTGTYSDPDTDTTLAAYVPSALEKLIRKPASTLSYLIEINPKMTLRGFTNTSGHVWEITVDPDDRGISFNNVYENGVAYAVKTSVATVEATASTYWHDYYNSKLYIHTSNGTDPISFLIEGSFWLYFVNV
jgi:hypothetical protein